MTWLNIEPMEQNGGAPHVHGAHGHRPASTSLAEMHVSEAALDSRSIIARRPDMQFMKLTLVSLALVLIGSANVAVAGPRQAANPYECFTDDGYGRKRSCSQGFKQKRVDKGAKQRARDR
jgi:hypothetical protein